MNVLMYGVAQLRAEPDTVTVEELKVGVGAEMWYARLGGR
jgi:hypothetical protein